MQDKWKAEQEEDLKKDPKDPGISPLPTAEPVESYGITAKQADGNSHTTPCCT